MEEAILILRYLRKLLSLRLPEPEPVLPRAIVTAYDSALEDVGEREIPLGSNAGPYVEALRREVKLRRLAGGEWCAVFCSVHLERAGIRIKSRSAKRLVHAVARKGRRVRLRDLAPGMAGLSLHKRSGGWHVRLWKCVETFDGVLAIDYVGGNEGHRVKSGRRSAAAYVATAKMLATV